jgi:short-subunit dehydrogenase
MKIEGRTALVTGASGGIGREIAKAVHARGATVVISARRGELLDELRAEFGDRAEAVVADLANPEDVARLAERARAADILVANAALPAQGPVDWFEAREIERAIEVNLTAPIQLARAMVPAMKERGHGHLVFISSLLGRVTRANAPIYCATKFGLRGFALGLRDDLFGTEVGVTTIMPGFIRDAGMYAETGLEFPKGTATSSPAEVAAAVVNGIEQNIGEIVVAPRQLRIGSWIAAAFPGFGAKVMRKRNPPEFSEQVAKAHAERR